jgi:hypothetical protein
MELSGKTRSIRVFLLGASLAAATVLVIRGGASRAGEGRDMSELGLAEFVQSEITYDGVMHEFYWHYEFANQMIRVGRTEDALAHLKMITFYVNLLPYLTREKKFFKDAESSQIFDKHAQELLSLVNEISRSIKSGNISEEEGKMIEKRIAYLCYHCHKDLKTPIRDITPYGKKIQLGAGSVRSDKRRVRTEQ